MGSIIAVLLVVLPVVLPVACFAVSNNTPESYSLSTYGWVVAIAILGGVTSFAGRASRLSWVVMTGELAVSAFSGIITFWLCEYLEIAQLASAALVGIVGHMGSRGMVTLERIGIKFFQGKLHVTIEDENEDDDNSGGQ
jgi:hypothetical protein